MPRILSALVLIALVSGCHLRPDWGAPGPIGVQRTRAVLNDPFPSDELGPEIKGVRPRGFDLPEHRAKGLQKYAPQANVVPANTPFQFAPQQIVPQQHMPTQIVPTQTMPIQPYPTQPGPVQPGYPGGYAP